MCEFSRKFQGLSAEQAAQRYERLARAALAHYGLRDAAVTFVQHNGGVTYRVQTREDARSLLLKIAEPVGDGSDTHPEHLRTGLAWLEALGRETKIVVQQPVATVGGELLATVAFDDLREPFNCSLHLWVEGEHAPGDLTPAQARRVGGMMARLHAHGRTWLHGAAVQAQIVDTGRLDDHLRTLGRVVNMGLVSAAEWRVVEAAHARIRAEFDACAVEQQGWGPVHGDLHQGNLLFNDGDVWPIDFGGLMLAPWMYDLGVTLYHVMYLGAGVRRALLDGYRDGCTSELCGAGSLESWIGAAALENLAFQITIPAQPTSPHFLRNVHEFACRYCVKLAAGELFALV